MASKFIQHDKVKVNGFYHHFAKEATLTHRKYETFQSTSIKERKKYICHMK